MATPYMNNSEHTENRPRTALSEDWKKHYAAAHRRVAVEGYARSMDYSNERCELQIYAHLLEAVGPLSEKRLLDAGCGWGITSMIFKACGADVTGVDIIPETSAALRLRISRIHTR
jgi:cyclopropane fatty-acyl-phospholipid synthase-like methyltransferase